MEAASVSVAKLLTDEQEEMELGEIDDQLVVSSVASQKCEELVLDMQGMPTMGTNPMVNFQLVDYKRRNDPWGEDITFQGFSYSLPTFLPKDFLEKCSAGADQRATKDNLTGMADVAHDALLAHR